MAFLQKNWFKVLALLLILFLGLSFLNIYKEAKNQEQAAREASYDAGITEQERLDEENKRVSGQERQRYVAQRKQECLEIYKVEQAEWSNTNGWGYEEDSDQCQVTYEDLNATPKSRQECEAGIQTTFIEDFEADPSIFVGDGIKNNMTYQTLVIDCINGTIRKNF